MSENIIEIIGLTYKNIFNDFSLGIEENKFITIAGPNNCGKTTLLRMLDNQIEISNTFTLYDIKLEDYKLTDLYQIMKIIKDRNDFLDTIKEGVTLVDFFATWCGPCKMLAPVLEEVSKEFEGRAKVVKVDVDELRDLAMEYRIASVPTVILFKDGEFIAQTMGFRPKQQFTDALEKVINM